MNTNTENKPSVGEILHDCIEKLNEVRHSGYLPFASPAPCSTERNIKNAIERAVTNLEIALANHEAEFGKGRLPEYGFHCSVITEVK